MGCIDTLSRCSAAILDLVAPRTCAACSAPVSDREPWCPTCRQTLQPPTRGTIGYAVEVLGASPYAGPTARAIKALKYAGRADLGTPLGAWLARHWQAMKAPEDSDALVPVPLHPRRLAERGYNQAALIARGIALASGSKWLPRAMVRTRDTLAQATLSAAARRSNPADAFACPRHMGGSRVWIVDDVVTTGATAAACVRCLEAAGASVQGVLCLGIADGSERRDEDAQLI